MFDKKNSPNILAILSTPCNIVIEEMKPRTIHTMTLKRGSLCSLPQNDTHRNLEIDRNVS